MHEERYVGVDLAKGEDETVMVDEHGHPVSAADMAKWAKAQGKDDAEVLNQAEFNAKLDAALEEGRVTATMPEAEPMDVPESVTSAELEAALVRLRAAPMPHHPEADELAEGLQHNGIVSVTARVKGRIVYQGPVDSEEIRNAIAAVMVQHRRKFRIVIRLADGTKQAYRGNGARCG